MISGAGHVSRRGEELLSIPPHGLVSGQSCACRESDLHGVSPLERDNGRVSRHRDHYAEVRRIGKVYRFCSCLITRPNGHAVSKDHLTQLRHIRTELRPLRTPEQPYEYLTKGTTKPDTGVGACTRGFEGALVSPTSLASAQWRDKRHSGKGLTNKTVRNVRVMFRIVSGQYHDCRKHQTIRHREATEIANEQLLYASGNA